MKRIILLILNIVFIAGIIFLMGFSQITHNQRICPEMQINIDYGNREFATEVMLVHNDVDELIKSKYGAIQGKPLKQINLEEIENTILTNNFVKDIDLQQEMNGKLVLKITQRRPIMRVFGKTGKSFYIDESGHIVPIKIGFPARVIVASGNIIDQFFANKTIDLFAKTSDTIVGIAKLRNLYLIGKHIDNDEFFRKEITQIDINTDNQITLIPLVGQHIIVMETFNNYQKKLKKLKIFYNQILNQGGWANYNKINIEFENQIVCTKNK